MWRGLSPRARGSRQAVGLAVGTVLGSIPAGAGKPISSAVCGSIRRASGCVAGGLSPRARGSPSPRRSSCFGVYPRGRGEAATRVHAGRQFGPVYPRGRGEAPGVTSIADIQAWRVYPRGRGEALKTDIRDEATRVYPRGRGEARCCRKSSRRFMGLSPRARGSLQAARYPPRLQGLSPRARGSLLCLGIRYARVYPRGRGEAAARRTRLRSAVAGRSIPAGAGKPRKRQQQLLDQGLSPRARGSRRPCAAPDIPLGDPGSIPAGAGKPDGSHWQSQR